MTGWIIVAVLYHGLGLFLAFIIAAENGRQRVTGWYLIAVAFWPAVILLGMADAARDYIKNWKRRWR